MGKWNNDNVVRETKGKILWSVGFMEVLYLGAILVSWWWMMSPLTPNLGVILSTYAIIHIFCTVIYLVVIAVLIRPFHLLFLS